jgi:hypothetical protein
MLVLGIAVAIALALPLLTGGSYTRLVMTDWRWTPLLFVGLGLQLALEFLPIPESRWDDVGYGFLVLSYVLIIAFCARNLLLRGMVIVLVGVACNAAVIVVNNGMPVDVPEDWEGKTWVEETVKHHPQGDDDRLLFLSDIIVLRAPFDTVISFGDLILAVGLCDVTYHASRKRKPRQLPAPLVLDTVPANGVTPVPRGAVVTAPTLDLTAVGAGPEPRAAPGLQPAVGLVSTTTRSSALNTRSS